ncbi:immunoglobulin superfamily containing leucine-rich repeat protein-like isoform X2 [Argiope bruennichi]|uniref:immunoglobulin superfamily containing leucine-rich repeat protein-like isoform X2 n=1 Tax=Argiope bruennichi TaxID=94029 RepID=UPI002493EFBD|nr:immunoglobulin superfamily containing leucine-rich repeat protein-like isoform X2 [Argiope bruennichi]
MFPTPANIQILDFSWNKISVLPDDIFNNMPTLTDVFLEGNRLKTFPARTWEKLIDNNLSQVTLADNPIVCDCGIKWYTKKRRSVRVTGKCAEPQNLRNYNLIQLTPGDFNYCPK